MQKSKPVTIALNMIVKDDTEVDSLERCLASFSSFVDGVFVCATGLGKKKKVKKLIEKYGTYKEISPKTNPEVYYDFDDGAGPRFAHFGNARNAALEMVPDDYTWVMWADSDDVLFSGKELREVAEVGEKKKVDAVAFTYWYAVLLNEDGTVRQVIIDHTKERLFKKDKFTWKDRLHENIFVKDDAYQPLRADWSYNPEEGINVVWVHLNDPDNFDNTRERNARILELQATERGSSDARDFHYLGKTYFDMGEMDKANDAFDKHLELSGWNEERSLSLEYKALIQQQLGNYRESIPILLQGIQEYPMLHVLYLRLCAAYFETGQVPFAKHWLSVAEKLPSPTTSTAITNQFEIKQLLVSLKIKESLVDQDHKALLHWAKVRADIMGKDDGLLQDARETDALNHAATGAFNIAKWMGEHGYDESIEPFLRSLPEEVTDQPYMRIITEKILPPEKWPEKSIAYVCTHGGSHFEKWGAGSVEKGIGGSETAVIELSKRWAYMGYKVVVFADTDTPGMHDGVEWRKPWELNWKDEFDTVIVWRMTHLLENDIKANKICVDLHDVVSQLDWPEEIMDKVDKVFFKSNYHRAFIPKLPDSKVEVISNGI